MHKSFPCLLEDFILLHLNRERGLSKATVSSCYTALEQYIFWLRDVKGQPFADMDVSSFAKGLIKEFLNYLEETKHASAAIRNLRKAGILSFLCYAADVEPVYMNSYLEARNIRGKRACRPQRDFLTIEEYRTLLECIDTDMPEGRKHYVLIHTMYETAARVSEVAGMDIQNFSFGKENSVAICGKGSKYRRVYLNDATGRLPWRERKCPHTLSGGPGPPTCC